MKPFAHAAVSREYLGGLHARTHACLRDTATIHRTLLVAPCSARHFVPGSYGVASRPHPRVRVAVRLFIIRGSHLTAHAMIDSGVWSIFQNVQETRGDEVLP